MKRIIKAVLTLISSYAGQKINGKFLGFLDFCRTVICENQKCFAGSIHYRMKLENILPEQGVRSEYRLERIPETDRIKLRIVYPSGDSWNNIHTLYESFICDDRFQTIVLVENRQKYISIMEDVKCSYFLLDEYRMEEDMPDILIATYYSCSDAEISFPDCRKYVGKVFAVIPNAVMNEKNRDIHWQYIQNAYHYLKPDYYLADKMLYRGLLGYVENEKLIEMGNPQFDEIYLRNSKEAILPPEWKKLSGKKTVLWATDHGINESYPTNGFTVDLYLKSMLEYFCSHTELGLIFRPHPQFLREMEDKGCFWSREDVVRIKEFFRQSENMVWDDTYDFCCAYQTCSAILVDANCSITCSALVLDKPICRILRNDISEWLISPELQDCYYYARGFDECVDYFEMIKNEMDPKAEIRRAGIGKSICNYDGKNGERLKSFISKAYIS